MVQDITGQSKPNKLLRFGVFSHSGYNFAVRTHNWIKLEFKKPYNADSHFLRPENFQKALTGKDLIMNFDVRILLNLNTYK